VDSGVHEITEDEIDDPVFAAERDCGFGTFARKWIEPGSFASCEHNAEDSQAQSTLHTDRRLLFGNLIFSHSDLPRTAPRKMLPKVQTAVVSAKPCRWNERGSARRDKQSR
jgi:hypothetical protein